MINTATGEITQRNVMGEVKKPSEIRQEQGLCLAIVGEGGAGKTTLLHTLLESERCYPVLIFDMLGATKVLKDDPNIDIQVLTTQKQIDEKRQLLIRYAGSKDFKYKTVVWDVVTTLQQIGLVESGLTPIVARGGQTQRLYGGSNLDMAIFFREQSDLASTSGLNIIMTMWDDTTLIQGQVPTIKHEMNITHGASLAAMAALDYIFFIEKDGDQYPPVMYTNRLDYKTKLRAHPDSPLRHLPKTIYQPSLASIIDCFHGAPWPTERHARRQKEPTQ